MPYHILGISGMPGAGKTVVIETLKEELEAIIVTMGDMVREQVRLEGLPLSPENLGTMAEKLREIHGPDAVAVLTMKKIKKLAKDGDLIVIDGIRSMHEVNLFRNEWNVVIIAIHAPPNIRHHRLILREREDDVPTLEHCRERDARELGFGVGDVIALADKMILNDDDEKMTIHDIQSRILEIAKRITNRGAEES
ncbi:MAG: AAA family ATPase [Promethearchaeota archaeon]